MLSTLWICVAVPARSAARTQYTSELGALDGQGLLASGPVLPGTPPITPSTPGEPVSCEANCEVWLVSVYALPGALIVANGEGGAAAESAGGAACWSGTAGRSRRVVPEPGHALGSWITGL